MSANNKLPVELIPEDKPGFWEENGYHIYGDPWREQRYSFTFQPSAVSHSLLGGCRRC
ncbi:MAG: hypothetical protein LC781_22105 [Actinobacteria bacterium]|nr:hypothetical protein [Actinomycetota bacterium]